MNTAHNARVLGPEVWGKIGVHGLAAVRWFERRRKGTHAAADWFIPLDEALADAVTIVEAGVDMATLKSLCHDNLGGLIAGIERVLRHEKDQEMKALLDAMRHSADQIARAIASGEDNDAMRLVLGLNRLRRAVRRMALAIARPEQRARLERIMLAHGVG